MRIYSLLSYNDVYMDVLSNMSILQLSIIFTIRFYPCYTGSDAQAISLEARKIEVAVLPTSLHCP